MSSTKPPSKQARKQKPIDVRQCDRIDIWMDGRTDRHEREDKKKEEDEEGRKDRGREREREREREQ